MAQPIEFFFEFASTYTYLSAMRVPDGLRWRPFLLGPIFAARGFDDSPFNVDPLRGRYMWRDVERGAALHGLAWKRPSQFPRNSVLAARVAAAAEDEPWMPAYARAVFRANFVEDRDIAAPEVVGDALRAAGQDADAWLLRAVEQKARLRANTEEAQRRGVFGAPTFFVGDEMFFGNDRLEQALDWARR